MVFTTNLFSDLRLFLSHPKSILCPSQKIPFIGAILASIEGRAFLPEGAGFSKTVLQPLVNEDSVPTSRLGAAVLIRLSHKWKYAEPLEAEMKVSYL